MTTQTAIQEKSLFPLGQTVATPGAVVVMQGLGILPGSLLGRHQRGDWGDLDEEDKQRNDSALVDGSRIFSAYQVAEAVKFWVITEADRSATTILLPEDY